MQHAAALDVLKLRKPGGCMRKGGLGSPLALRRPCINPAELCHPPHPLALVNNCEEQQVTEFSLQSMALSFALGGK